MFRGNKSGNGSHTPLTRLLHTSSPNAPAVIWGEGGGGGCQVLGGGGESAWVSAGAALDADAVAVAGFEDCGKEWTEREAELRRKIRQLKAQVCVSREGDSKIERARERGRAEEEDQATQEVCIYTYGERAREICLLIQNARKSKQCILAAVHY